VNGRDRGPASEVKPLPTAGLLSVIGGSSRLEILRMLALRPIEVSALAEKLDLSISGVSHNLRILYEHGLVQWEQKGTVRVYRVSTRVRTKLRGGRLWLVVNSDDEEPVRIGLRAGSTAVAPSVLRIGGAARKGAS
jgi:DNA-binding transcriptional ArsR family regulator